MKTKIFFITIHTLLTPILIYLGIQAIKIGSIFITIVFWILFIASFVSSILEEI